MQGLVSSLVFELSLFIKHSSERLKYDVFLLSMMLFVYLHLVSLI
jgi:hypothetical protein